MTRTAYDGSLPLVCVRPANPRPVTLRPPEWRLPIDMVAAASGPRTRAVLLNDPLDPAARGFAASESAALCIVHDLVVICDEVREHVLSDGRANRPLLGFDGMTERAVKIGSSGKIFALTGWKIGFVLAAPALHSPIARAHQFLTIATPPNLQAAVAYGLGKEPGFFAEIWVDRTLCRRRGAARADPAVLRQSKRDPGRGRAPVGAMGRGSARGTITRLVRRQAMLLCQVLLGRWRLGCGSGSLIGDCAFRWCRRASLRAISRADRPRR